MLSLGSWGSMVAKLKLKGTEILLTWTVNVCLEYRNISSTTTVYTEINGKNDRNIGLKFNEFVKVHG